MNLVKGIVYFLLIMLVAGLLAALFAPSTKEVRRSIKIEAPVDAVFNQVASFENWKKWDARYQKDPSQKRTYNGSVGDKSYGYKWESDNDDVGKGSMTMDAVAYNERLDYTLYFNEKPNRGHFAFTHRSSTTEVEWVMTSKLSYPMTILNYFIDGMVGSDFENGLANLKEYTEKTPLVVRLPKDKPVVIVEEHGVNYALVKVKDLPIDKLGTFFENGYNKVFTHIQTNGLVPKGPPRGLFYEWNEKEGMTTLAVAVPVSDVLRELEAQFQVADKTVYLGGDYISSTVVGGNSRVYETHRLLSKWTDENAKSLKMPIVEEYIKGSNDTQDTSQYQTKVTYYFD
jgi:effector-binding domain-containing protein